jgi:hypothetical protein
MLFGAAVGLHLFSVGHRGRVFAFSPYGQRRGRPQRLVGLDIALRPKPTSCRQIGFLRNLLALSIRQLLYTKAPLRSERTDTIRYSWPDVLFRFAICAQPFTDARPADVVGAFLFPLSLFLGHHDLVPLRRRDLEFFDRGLDRIIIVFGIDDTEILVFLTKLYTPTVHASFPGARHKRDRQRVTPDHWRPPPAWQGSQESDDLPSR